MGLLSSVDRLERADSGSYRDMILTVTISAAGSTPEERSPVTVTINGEPPRPCSVRPSSGAPWRIRRR